MIWNFIPPDPVCTIQEKTNPAQKQRKLGPRRNHSQGRFDAFRFSSYTCCSATVLVGLTSKYKKAMRLEFQKWTENGELCNRYTTLEELTSEMKGKKNKKTTLLPPLLPLPTRSPFTQSSRLAIFRIHFYFNPCILYTSISMLLTTCIWSDKQKFLHNH